MTLARLVAAASLLICAYCTMMLCRELSFYSSACWDFTKPHPGFGLAGGWLFPPGPLSNFYRVAFAWPARIALSGALVAYGLMKS